MSLRDFQQNLLSQIYNKGGNIDNYIIDGYAENIGIYINNCHLILGDILKDKFPICAKLIGEDFAHFAQKYCLDNPLEIGDVTFFGLDFPEFIKQYDLGEITPLIYDIAKIENAKFNCELSEFETHINLEDFNNLIANNNDAKIKITATLQMIECETNALSAFTLSNAERLNEYEFIRKSEKIIIWRGSDFNINLLIIDDFWNVLINEYRKNQNIINALNNALPCAINQTEAQNQFIQACENGLFIISK